MSDHHFRQPRTPYYALGVLRVTTGFVYFVSVTGVTGTGARSEQADIKEQEKEVFAELKGRGYMSRPVRTLIALRKRKPDDVAEEEAILEMYKAALGMV